jgi:hypothetical protein
VQKMFYKKVGVLVDAEGRPYNPRGLPGDTTELRGQIQKSGQRTPIAVTLPNDKGIHLVTRGHRRKAAIDALRTEARAQVRHWKQQALEDPNNEEAMQHVAIWQGKVERWSHYLIEVHEIDPADLPSVLSDMDAGIIQKEVDPVSLGETMVYRMDHLGWSFMQCIESLGLTETRGKACIRAADPNQTSPSVQSALRTGEMSISMFLRKFSRMDRLTQERVMKEAEARAEGSKQGHGVVNASIINAVIEDLTGQAKMPTSPDQEVLVWLADATGLIRKALDIRTQWSGGTWATAMWKLEEIRAMVDAASNEEQEIGA